MPAGFAARAGAEAVTTLTFNPDHLVGADQGVRLLSARPSEGVRLFAGPTANLLKHMKACRISNNYLLPTPHVATFSIGIDHFLCRPHASPPFLTPFFVLRGVLPQPLLLIVDRWWRDDDVAVPSSGTGLFQFGKSSGQRG